MIDRGDPNERKCPNDQKKNKKIAANYDSDTWFLKWDSLLGIVTH